MIPSYLALPLGRRAVTGSEPGRGRQTGSRPRKLHRETASVDVNATLAKTAARQAMAGEAALPLHPLNSDLQSKIHQRLRKRLVVFAVDLSDSMGDGPRNRMGAALGAALALTGESYRNRDMVSLITFRETEARVIVPPTDKINMVRQQLKKVAIGGATPLADCLTKALQVIRQARAKFPGIAPRLVLISDGEPTTAINPGGDPVQDALDAANRLRREQIPAIIIDTSLPLKGAGIMPRLVEAMAARSHRLLTPTAGKVLALIDGSDPEMGQ